MSALAALSKYQGRYNHWKEIRQNFNLKWSSGNNALQSLERFFNPNSGIDSMLQWVRDAIRVLPANMGAIIKYNCLIGLRPSECIESAKLLVNLQPDNKYYDEERQELQHWRYPELFIRKTKNSYVSFITKEQLSRIGILGAKTPISIPSWNTIRLTCKRKGLDMHMNYCRKLHASWLHHQGGVSNVLIDMLQGRVGQSVLVNHYVSMSEQHKQQVLKSLDKLKAEISGAT
jgi:intergrase/recombinase